MVESVRRGMVRIGMTIPAGVGRLGIICKLNPLDANIMNVKMFI